MNKYENLFLTKFLASVLFRAAVAMARRAPSMVVLSAALAESNLARAALSVMIWVLRLWDLSLAEMIVVFPLGNMLWSQLLAPA